MLLNISDKEWIYDPGEANLERAVASIQAPKVFGLHEMREEESFALLLKTDRKGDFVSAERIPLRYRLPEYVLRFRDASSGCAYQAWVPRAEIVTAIFKVFCAGVSPLNACFAQGFIWCDHTYWGGENAQTAPGLDVDAEERLEEDACITLGDVVNAMFDVREHNPQLAEWLETPSGEGEDTSTPLATRAESLAWMRVAIVEDELEKLHREYRKLTPERHARKLRLAQQEWAKAMRSWARLARDREQWNSDAELEMKWLELNLAFRRALPQIRALRLSPPFLSQDD